MIIITGFNDAQAPLAELTVPLMRDYAKRHKLGFRCAHFDAIGKEAYWQKILLTLQAFDEGFDRVFWLDVDQAITNPETEPWGSEFIPKFAASRDWGSDAGGEDFSMCGYIATQESRAAFTWVNDRHDECIAGDFPEQTPMREYFQKFGDFVISPRRKFNAVPDEVSPGNVVEPWQPGDFAAHITMCDIPRRIEIFHQVMARNK